MPNGGSDCCGTCWFNSKNEGKPGYHGADKPGIVRCTIRNIETDDPFYTYCANHPHHNRQKISVPLGPVYRSKHPGRAVWIEAPKSEEITVQLLELLKSITNDVQSIYPSPIDFEEIIIDQLTELKEKRAIPGLLDIISMDIDGYRNYDPDNLEHVCIRNKIPIVGKAIRALFYISNGMYLDQVDFFVDLGVLESRKQEDKEDKDPFFIIRFYFILGLQFCPFEKVTDLLKIAIKDPHPSVRNAAKELQSHIKNASEKSAYGRRRGTAIVETEQGIIVVTHDNRQYLLPGGSPKRGELQIQAAIRELREETGLKAYDVRYLFTHMAAKVFLMKAEGDPEPRNEITKIDYYQNGSQIKVSNNTRLIIEKYWESLT